MKSLKLLPELGLIVLLFTTVAGCTTTASPIDIGIVIMDHDKNLMWQGNITVEELTPLAALDEASLLGGFDYEINPNGNYVTSIMNLSENSEGAMWLGWMFFVNETMPLEAVSSVHLMDGSTLVWYYGSFGESPFT
jgi:hypothetical protein